MRKILVCVVFMLVCCVTYAQHTGQYKIGGKIEGMDFGRGVMKQKRWRGIRS
mgnify:CR=1 FL=1